MGAPFFEIRDLCKKNNVQVFSTNFSLYTDMSVRVMKTLSQFAPRLEYYSIDESWLDLSGFKNWNMDDYGREIKRTVELWTGIPVSVGIAPTKTMAKIANRAAKKNPTMGGVCSVVTRRQQDALLRTFPIEDIWGVGRASPPKFHALGIRSAADLRDYTNHNLIQKIFTRTGRMMQDELRGIPCHPVTPEGVKKKEIMQSRTFSTPIYDRGSLIKALAGYTHSAAARMRGQGSVCTEIHAFARTNAHQDIEQYRAYEKFKFNTATSNTLRLTRVICMLANKMFRPGYGYKKAGIRLIGLKDADEYQGSLFDPGDTKKSQALMETMDKINWREGPLGLKSMACGTSDKAWRMNRDFLSPRYTTSWNELPKCK